MSIENRIRPSGIRRGRGNLTVFYLRIYFSSGLSAVGKCCLQASVLYGASAVLRAFVLTGSVWKPVVLIHCEETLCRSWSQGSTVDDIAWPKKVLLVRPETQLLHEIFQNMPTSVNVCVELANSCEQLHKFQIHLATFCAIWFKSGECS